MPRMASIAVALLLGGSLACGGADDAPPAVLDLGLAPRLTLPLDALPARVALAPGQDFRVLEIGREPHSSHHLVAIRDAEVPHRHERHDLLVVILRGRGSMRLGDDTRPVGEGSVLWVPRGTLHAFRNTGSEPASAYAIYTPAFDGQDRIDAE